MYCINKVQLDLVLEIRDLWTQHATWTGMAVKSITLQLPDEEVVVNRLLRNPMDFSFALRPFYGPVVADEFANLLTEHLQLAGAFIKATMAGDRINAIQLENKWYQNADEIAAFLGNINPYWSDDNWRLMLHEHLGFVKILTFSLLDGNYAGNVETYDIFSVQALEMANMMAKGIIRQFYCYL